MQVETLVIGGGPGGTPVAMALAAAGRRVLLVERGAGLGGTCLFEGCIPSKILRESARRLDDLGHASELGVVVPPGEARVDWSAIMARKQAILKRRADAALEHARAIPTLGVRFGEATLLGPRHARLVLREGAPEDVEFTTAILATGSVPTALRVPGTELPEVLTSEQLLEIERRPRRLAVIGAGPIGVEMAQIFAALGTRVTLIEAASRILTPVDEEIALALQAHIRAQGVELALDAQVTGIERRDGETLVHYRDAAGLMQAAATDVVLEVTGRHPRVEGLGLEHTAVRFDAHGIRVDGRLETDEPGVFALGDVVGQPMFAHWATAQALALARHLLGEPVRFPTPATNTAVIFSMPEVGAAGSTEAEARRAGHHVAVARYDYRTDARAQVSGRAEGLLKLVYDRTTRAVLGVHVLLEGADTIMGEAALALAAGLPVEALASAIHPHPTLTESMGLVARNAASQRE